MIRVAVQGGDHRRRLLPARRSAHVLPRDAKAGCSRRSRMRSAKDGVRALGRPSPETSRDGGDGSGLGSLRQPVWTPEVARASSRGVDPAMLQPDLAAAGHAGGAPVTSGAIGSEVAAGRWKEERWTQRRGKEREREEGEKWVEPMFGGEIVAD
ncbi:hypothetical protein PR202_ga00029 [Eleusine coracana subsp. coracana]|uniref:Uncharacterized protein n=1 Tax=Eleusine coracana subsp. coracana TaxID=191504 RepID=A0AAV5BEE7_ELECO|nr:hypothetical protein PR202_ga00029 [Eleusine coracana subsp. coracana]